MKQVELTWEDQKKMNAFVESTKETGMSIMEKIKQNAVDLWEKHKAEILIGTIWGGIGIYSVVAIALGFKRQKVFNQEVKAKYGPNATHGNIFSGSMSKRRANLEAWEQGNCKTEFNRVMEFAKTLKLNDGDAYTIEGINDPGNNRIAVSVWQSCGDHSHADRI